MKYFLLIITSILFILGGCQYDNVTAPIVNSKEATFYNELPSQYKTIDKAKLQSAIPIRSRSYLKMLNDAFKKQTSSDYVSSSHSVYVRNPNVHITFDSGFIPINGTYEFTLYEYVPEMKKFVVLNKEVTLSKRDKATFKLPNKENKAYYVGKVAKDHNGKIVKREYTEVFVPYNVYNAKIELNKTVLTSSESLEVTLTNLGVKDLTTGYGVQMEKLQKNSWISYQLHQFVPLVMMVLTTGQSFSQWGDLKELTPGTYRIVYPIGDGKIGAEFNIVDREFFRNGLSDNKQEKSEYLR
ncbi:immunoglobulin-like domain-containing protein [Falsibacillus albus]|uniref:Bacterial Ig-like domain-containing protein n=1 Tax=Falsibacillus albus TaxID=2478915 RepID=A0A3L7K186_9BACI|nr:immunoglobulin-like domain-containing protein [Falsibacillus albus]RLQ96816.1 hypothetical protein D9X91_06875 [Falsibacillus albus]